MSLKKKILITLSIFTVVVTLIELSNQQMTDWTATFDKDDKVPFGTHVFNELLPELFPNSDISFNTASLFETLDTLDTKGKRKTIMIMYKSWYRNYIGIDKLSMERLLTWVKNGNTAFINIAGSMDIDTLKLKISNYNYNYGVNNLNNDSAYTQLLFYNNKLNKNIAYNIDKGDFDSKISRFDTLNAELLAYDTLDGNSVKFLRQKIGNGYLYYSTLPFVFTNYNLLYGEPDLAVKMLSYLPKNNDLIIDEYYKLKSAKTEHSLRYIFSQQPLKWAYFTILFSTVIFIIIGLKRKQRAIPILKKHKNSSLEFIQTISNLYLEENDNKFIAEKKIKHFKKLLQNKFNINFKEMSSELQVYIAQRTGTDLGLINDIFNDIRKIKLLNSINSHELIKLNNNIDKFYKKVNYGN